jgi:glycosyltransferase involved in cell wall biosynthesis
VLQAAPQTRFRIVGDDPRPGPGGKTYKEGFLAEHGRRDWIGHVQFTGRVGDDELDQAYARCDVFVAPSRFESFGLVFVEAMRVGKAVIGCHAGGMPEVVSDGVNGLLVEPGDTDGLAQAILRLVQDPVLRASMGAAGHRLFEERFTARRMAEDSAGLYELAQRNFEAAN